MNKKYEQMTFCDKCGQADYVSHVGTFAGRALCVKCYTEAVEKMLQDARHESEDAEGDWNSRGFDPFDDNNRAPSA